MCGKTPKVPTVIQRDPAADQLKAEAEAQLKVNSETANKRRRKLESGGGMSAAARAAQRDNGAATNSLLAQAKPGG